jgi:hypothetical protein
MPHPWFLPPPQSTPLHFPTASSIPDSPRWSYDFRYLPSIEERRAALTVMANLKADLEECDQSLEYLKRTEQRIRKNQKALKKAMKHHSLLGYWSCQLPQELLSKIFLMLNDGSDMEIDKYWAARTLPLVCKHWKFIAEATIGLWNGQVFRSDLLPVSKVFEQVERKMYINPMIDFGFDASCTVLRLEE